MRGGVDPGANLLRPRVIGVVNGRFVGIGDGDLSSPGASGSWVFPERPLPPCALRPLIVLGGTEGGRRPTRLRLGNRWHASSLPIVL